MLKVLLMSGNWSSVVSNKAMCNLMIPNSLSNLAQLFFVIDAKVIARKSGRYLLFLS